LGFFPLLNVCRSLRHQRKTMFIVHKEQKVVAFKMLAIAVGISALATSVALAEKPGDRGDTPGLGWGKGGSHQITIIHAGWDRGEHDGDKNHGGTSVGVPGPIAGAGLPLAAIIGGYFWLQRRQRRNSPPAM
jgi:hypothetical protein